MMRSLIAIMMGNQSSPFEMGRYLALGAMFVLICAGPAQVKAAEAGKKFESKALTMDLPMGWDVKAPPAGDKETIATFSSTKHPGTSVVALAYKGPFVKYSYARIRMLKNAAAALPGGQEQLKDKHKIKTDNGIKVWLELWRGLVPAEGQKVMLSVPTAIFKSPSKHWIVLIGFTSESKGEWLEKEMLAMVNGVKK